MVGNESSIERERESSQVECDEEREATGSEMMNILFKGVFALRPQKKQKHYSPLLGGSVALPPIACEAHSSPA